MWSVVVPVRGEGPPDGAVVRMALAAEEDVELLVAADESAGEDALERWRRVGARVVAGTGPRGERLRRAAGLSRGERLLFLHADTLLPGGWARSARTALEGGAVAGAFRLAFDPSSKALSTVAFFANLRTRLTRVPYGDQAPFVRRDAYERCGGHPPWPLLDDVELFRRLKREGPIALLPDSVLTSPRRYEARGVARTVLGNWSILLRFHLGASPRSLADRYHRP